MPDKTNHQSKFYVRLDFAFMICGRRAVPFSKAEQNGGRHKISVGFEVTQGRTIADCEMLSYVSLGRGTRKK